MLVNSFPAWFRLYFALPEQAAKNRRRHAQEQEAMRQTKATKKDKKEFQGLRTATLEHLEAAIAGITAIMAWREDLTAQTNS